MLKYDLSQVKQDFSDQAQLQRYFVASMSLSGGQTEGWTTYFTQACQWYANLLGLGFNRVPFFLVHDLGVLLLKGSQFPFRALSSEEGDSFKGQEKILRSNYENRILNRVLNIPIFYEMSDVVEETGGRSEIISLFLERLLSPLKKAPLPILLASPHQIRSLGAISAQQPDLVAEELDLLYREKYLTLDVEVGDDYLNFFEEQCQVLSDAFEMLPLQSLVGIEDVFVARHYDTLGGRAQRMVARLTSEVEKSLGAAPPPPANWVPETPEVKVTLEDAGVFPQGGLDEMSNRGSFENLVQSQLAFMDSDGSDIDVFTLRYVEGELLYYTRDEGQLLRRSRAIHIFLDLDESYEFHYPGQPARLDVLLKAFLHRFIDDLFAIFESDSVKILLHPVGPRAQELSNSWGIRFSDRVEKGEVVIGEAGLDLSEEPSPYIVPGRITTALYIGPKEAPSDEARRKHYRSGLGIFWTRLDLELENSWVELDESDQKQWEFVLGAASAQILPTLSALKTQLAWRNFGS